MLVQLRVRYTFGVWSPSWANVRHDGDVSSIMIIPARTRMTDVF